MKNKLSIKALSLLLVAVMLLSMAPFGSLGELFVTTASGGEEYFDGRYFDGNYDYTLENDCATIVGVWDAIVGDLTIPTTLGGYPVTAIDEMAFMHCPLTNIYVEEGNQYFSSEEGVLFNKDKTVLILYPCNNPRTSYNVPNSVTTIASGAFIDGPFLENISVPDSVTDIGNFTFHGTAYYFNEANWENDTLYIDNHLIATKENISGDFFVKEGTITIDFSAFCCRFGLTSITIPKSVVSIGKWAFQGCFYLTSIEVAEDNLYFSSENGVLFNKEKTRLIKYPARSTGTSYTVPNSVTSISMFAFEYCEYLTDINVPDSVTSIGQCAFSGSVYYYNEANWENGALYVDNHLVNTISDFDGEYKIREGTKTIADYAFYFHEYSKITIPNSVTNIGESAFGYTILDYICYEGTEEEWNEIIVGDDNEPLEYTPIRFKGYFNINLPDYSVNNVNYKNYVKVKIVATGIPEGGFLVVDDNKISPNAEGIAIFEEKFQAVSSFFYSAQIENENGTSQTYSTSYSFDVDTSFFAKVKSFFTDFLFNWFKWKEVEFEFK